MRAMEGGGGCCVAPVDVVREPLIYDVQGGDLPGAGEGLGRGGAAGDP